MYYPRKTFNSRHEKIRVSKDSVFNLLNWATRFAFAIPQPAYTFHQTLTFPANVQDAKVAKTIFNKFLKSVFKRFDDYDLAAFYVIESSKSQRIHFHVCFSFFNFNNLPFAPSKMAKEFRADLFKRWNALNGENCVHAANCLKDQVFNLKTIAYFAKSLRIPAKPDARPETILWGVRGKDTLLKNSQKPSRELLNQTFDKLFKDGSRKQKKPANLLEPV